MASERRVRFLEVSATEGPGRKQDVRNWEGPLSVQIVVDPGVPSPEEGGQDYDYEYDYGATGVPAGALRLEVSHDGQSWSLPANTALQSVVAFPHPTIETITEKVNWVRVVTISAFTGSVRVSVAGMVQIS